MSKYTFFILLLTLPFLSQAADSKASEKYADTRLILYGRKPHDEEIRIKVPIKGNFTHEDIVLSLKRLYHTNNLVVFTISNSSGYVANAPWYPNVYKQLNQRELTGKPVRGTRRNTYRQNQ